MAETNGYYVKFTQMAWRVFNPEGEAIAAFHSDSRWDGSILARSFCEWINSPEISRRKAVERK